MTGTVHRQFALPDRALGRQGAARRAPSATESRLLLRITHVARDAALQRLLGGSTRARSFASVPARPRPESRRLFGDDADMLLGPEDVIVWDEVLAVEPSPASDAVDDGDRSARSQRWATSPTCRPQLRRALGRRRGPGERPRGAEASTRRGARESPRRPSARHRPRRGAPLYLAEAGPLDADEREKVRLHAYHTERMLRRSAFLATARPVAGAHHERLDGSATTAARGRRSARRPRRGCSRPPTPTTR